jgi:hypothetical protein
METVDRFLLQSGLESEVAWSAVMCPPNGLLYDRVIPTEFSHLLFVCGPLVGPAIAELHRRFAHCHRVAVGVSVLDWHDPAVTGFHHVLPRDAPENPPAVDLAAFTVTAHLPVVGVFLSQSQPEYGSRARHRQVNETLTGWLGGIKSAVVSLDTRLDPRDWRLASSPDQVESVIRRLDVVVTTRLHAMVLAIKNGIPALAVDPVDGGGKVSTQSQVLGWPVVPAATLDSPALNQHLRWCLSPPARERAQQCAARLLHGRPQLTAQLLAALRLD